ncbi:MAG: bile acid:sodium symporter, partial [Streptosporangiaceae bacterium]
MSLAAVLLPAAIALIMLGLGLALTVPDFRRVLASPRAVTLVLLCQLLVVPLIAYGLVVLFDPAPALGVGVMLLVATPGGPLSNLFSHLAGADVALNISLTAISSVISAASFPIIANLSVHRLMDGGRDVGLQTGKIVQVAALVIVPVVVGMAVRNRRPRFADRMESPVRRFSAVVLVLVVIGSVVKEREHLGPAFTGTAHIVLLLAALSLAIGYTVPRLGGVSHRQSVAASMEIGLHNTPLAIAVAMSPSMLNDSTMAFAPAIYAVVVVPMAALYTYLVS